MKYYAVKVGKSTGVFDNWPDCQEAVKGFSGAVYKSFSTFEEAEAFMDGLDIYYEMVKTDVDQGFAVAFCDGSYDEKSGRYSYGVLVIDKDLNEHEICGSAKNIKYVSSRNIIGEVLGAINAMDWALSNGYQNLKIYHDYEGLNKWLSGEWAAKSDVAKMFVSVYNAKYADLVNTTFEKVKGHSNNKYNDKADELAKSALNNNIKVAIRGDSWFSIPYFKIEELQAIIDLLSEEHEDIVIEKNENPSSIVYRLNLDKNKLVVTWFKSGNKKILVQGVHSILFQLFITYINELLGVKEEQVFADAYRKTIDTEKIDNGFKAISPEFPSDYPDNIKRLIRQSLINLTYFIECEDYSQYVFPALKALEGHMKYKFNKAGITIISKRGFSHFDKDSSTQRYYLPPSQIADVVLKRELEEYYNYYCAIRHSLFHYGDIMGSTDSTWIIETKQDADEHIERCLSYICGETI